MSVVPRLDRGSTMGNARRERSPPGRQVRVRNKAILIVRAEVADPSDRPLFDEWYGTEHLPEAAAVFGAERAWRSWSRLEPSVHYAFYEFDDVGAALAAVRSAAIASLVSRFDDAWCDRVTRTRDVVETVQDLQPPG